MSGRSREEEGGDTEKREDTDLEAQGSEGRTGKL